MKYVKNVIKYRTVHFCPMELVVDTDEINGAKIYPFRYVSPLIVL